MKEKAFAKVNLHLAVVEKRSDLYHNIQSVMASVALYDEIKVLACEKKKNGLSELVVEIDGRFKSVFDGLPVEENLIYKAFNLFFENVSYSVFLKIGLCKMIPAGAGLAGGSSDAAAMLRLLNKIFNCYSVKQLMRIAAKIGADVPFCLQKKAAFCTGIGNIISVYRRLKLSCYVVIVFSDVHISTKLAYQNVLLDKRDYSYKKFIKNKIYSKKWTGFFNSFEKYAIENYPKIGLTKKILYDNGAFFSLMSGSGSSVVGYFVTKEQADNAAKFLQKEGFDSIVSYLI